MNIKNELKLKYKDIFIDKFIKHITEKIISRIHSSISYTDHETYIFYNMFHNNILKSNNKILKLDEFKRFTYINECEYDKKIFLKKIKTYFQILELYNFDKLEEFLLSGG